MVSTIFILAIAVVPFGSLRAAKVDIDMSTAILLKVDQSGDADFVKIQDAIDAVPSNNKQVYFILVKPGTYREKIVVPADKPFITLSGTKPLDTIITSSEGGEIFRSATLTVLASNFVGRYLTIQNKFGTSGKAVAVRVSGDKAAFYGCRFLSYQDTLLDDADVPFAFPFERKWIHHGPKEDVTVGEHWFHFLGLKGKRHWCCFPR
ncbi:putative pectinesterase 11 isoform X2 [Gossypium hirsutum]|uniref:pectinesterase n=1 Tax=Gossypium hirsutum TaxID=3635 RepID=A0ABM3AUR3_GOSHI|nr:putative pectinesterase 11 isoform X2 [Gossypium hirsutum]